VLFADGSAGNACPYDDDYKHALQKALAGYLKDPVSSSVSLDEVKTMLAFYLKEESITNANCTPQINTLIEKADRLKEGQAPLDRSTDMNNCNVCPDGTLCAEKNEQRTDLHLQRHKTATTEMNTVNASPV